MKSFTLGLLVALLSSTVSAASNPDPYAWSPALATYYQAVANHIRDARDSDKPSPSCDLSNVQLPVAPTPLPAPDGMTLEHVAVGRGVQNYTCANSTASATPAAIGALASLWNASCLAANYPDLLYMIPGIALQITKPAIRPGHDGPNTLAPSDIQLSGHHFFSTNTTPIFELDSAKAADTHLGIVVGKKVANSTAPSSAPRGEDGLPAIAWLYLAATNKSETVDAQGIVRIGADASGSEWKAVYRVQTAGGSAPKTCEGLTDSKEGFSVDYASLYYFYKGNVSS